MLRLIEKFPFQLSSGHSSRLYFRQTLEYDQPLRRVDPFSESDLGTIRFPLANQLSQPLATAKPGILPEAFGEFMEASPEEKDLKGRQLLDMVCCTQIDG